MLTYGLHITQPNDPLQKLSIDLLVKKIKNPRPEFKARIEQIRRINEIDPKQYEQLKRGLPYFCCSIFNPHFRKKQNFASIRFFTLDFDHFSESDLSKEEVFEKLKLDEHIRFLFTTPSGDGLKAVFVLSAPIRDEGLYVHFYKAFSQNFAKKYKLNTVIDWVTHDVTRATFFSVDAKAWDNPKARPVNIEEYISLQINNSFKEIEKGFDQQQRAASKKNQKVEKSLDNQVLTIIKQRLNPKYKPKKKKEVFVPQRLNDVMPKIEEVLFKEGIETSKINSINYGKQIRVSMKNLWAELNIFYGKRGFSVVRTTKTGSHVELGKLAFQIIDQFLNSTPSLKEIKDGSS